MKNTASNVLLLLKKMGIEFRITDVRVKSKMVHLKESKYTLIADVNIVHTYNSDRRAVTSTVLEMNIGAHDAAEISKAIANKDSMTVKPSVTKYEKILRKLLSFFSDDLCYGYHENISIEDINPKLAKQIKAIK